MGKRHIEEKTGYFSYLLILFIALGPRYAYAQAPASTKAGIIEKKLKDDVTRSQRPQPKKAPVVQIEDKRSQQGKVSEKTKGGILVKKFLLNGVTIFTSEDLGDLLASYKDKYLGLKELNDIATAIQQFYRAKGYITTFVYIPQQKILNNTVEIRVVEGCIGNIEVEGGKYFSNELTRREFAIREGDTAMYKDLLKGVRRLNMNPDRTVKAVLLPGEKKDTTDIVLKVSDENPQHVFLEYNNQGTKYTGKQRFGTGYVNNNLLGWDDMLTIRYIRSNEKLNAGSIDYNLPINVVGTRLGGYFSYVQETLVREFTALNANGKAMTGGAYFAHPFLQEEHLRATFGSGLDIKHNWNYLLGTQTSSDNVSILKFNIGLDQDDAYGATYLRHEIDVGLPDFAGALGVDDPDASRLGAGGQFTKYLLNLGRRLNLPFQSFLLLSARGQYTPEKLVASEQFYIGGADTVRGYPELEYMGDYGYNTSVELRTPIYLLPKKMKLRDKLQMVYFFDYGQGYLRAPLVGEQKSQSLMGAGWGLRYNPWKNWYFKLDWGFPIDPQPSDKTKSTIHLWAHVDLV